MHTNIKHDEVNTQYSAIPSFLAMLDACIKKEKDKLGTKRVNTGDKDVPQ